MRRLTVRRPNADIWNRNCFDFRAMNAVYPAEFLVPELARERVLEAEVVEIDCRIHWAIMLLPVLILTGWLLAGLAVASIIANALSTIGQDGLTLGPQTIAGAFTVSAVLIGLLYWNSYLRCGIRLTTQRAIVRTGPLFNGAGEMDLSSAKLVAMNEPLLGRIFNYGTVSLIGSDGERLRLRFIPNPRDFYSRLNDLLSR